VNLEHDFVGIDMFFAYSFVVSKILVTFAATKGSRWCMPALYYLVWL